MKKSLVLSCLVSMFAVTFVQANEVLEFVQSEWQNHVSIKNEFGTKLTPQTLYDFNRHEYLGGVNLSLASYRCLVIEAGWAKSIEQVNTRGIAVAGATLQLNRSETIVNFVKRIKPDADLGWFQKLGLGGFAGYDTDLLQWRYGAYLGLVFDWWQKK